MLHKMIHLKNIAFIDTPAGINNNITVQDFSSVAQEISLLAEGEINAKTRVQPIINRSNNIGILNVESDDGYMLLSEQGMNAISNSMFINGNTDGWDVVSATKSATNNTMSINSIGSFGYSETVVKGGIAGLSTQLYLSFKYTSTATDALIYVLADGDVVVTEVLTQTGTELWYKKKFDFSSFLYRTDITVRIVPSAEGTGIVTIKTPTLARSSKTSKFGYYDIQNMYQ